MVSFKKYQKEQTIGEQIFYDADEQLICSFEGDEETMERLKSDEETYAMVTEMVDIAINIFRCRFCTINFTNSLYHL